MSTNTQQEEIIYQPCGMCWGQGRIYGQGPEGKLQPAYCPMCLGTCQVPEDKVRDLLRET